MSPGSNVSGGRAIDRRSFLLLRPTNRPRAFEISCEQLYMRYVDARLPKRRDRLFDRLRAELAGVDELRVSEREWLTDDLRLRVEALFEELRGRGVKIVPRASGHEATKDTKKINGNSSS